MATYDASVKKALTACQQDLIDHKEQHHSSHFILLLLILQLIDFQQLDNLLELVINDHHSGERHAGDR